MKKLRVQVFLMAFLLVFSAAALVSAADVEITLLNSKGEIQTQLEEIASYYSEITDGVHVEVIPVSAGQSPFERTVAMYASGNAPTLSMLDPGDVLRFRDRAYDLSGEQWVNDAIAGALDMVVTPEGEVKGFPVTVEGYGFIYNKVVLDEAVGSTFDPTTIRTRDDLVELFDQIEATGVGALTLSPMDWSLAGHFLPLAYATQSEDFEDVVQFQENLKAGNVSLQDNPQFQGLIDTFDVMREYNSESYDPLAATYDRGPEAIGQGEVGLWFMGNWAWPEIAEFDTTDGQYGFLPVPVSNNPEDLGNSQIPVGVTKFFILDEEQSSAAEREAAKNFLNWLVYDEEGQERIVVDANIIPAFGNIAIEPNDPLAVSILDYVGEGNTLHFITNLPPDHWSQVGASMQKYLVDVIDLEGLSQEVEAYWRGVN